MTNISDIMRPERFFDAEFIQYKELFQGISCVWEIVKNMQTGDSVNRLTREKCDNTTRAAGKNKIKISGSADVRVAGGCVIEPGVVVSGTGGLVCFDEGAVVKPGTFIETGGNAVYIGRGVHIGPNVCLDAAKGSICISDNAELRQGAYVRELSVICSGAVVGNSCEIKCSCIGREAEVPHFNYVGDSLLGFKTHLGAGVKISNLKIMPDPSKKDTVKIRHEGKTYDTGMRKLGAIIGDHSQIGCNSVTNPGTIIGKNVLIYAGSNVNGFIADNVVVKLKQTFEHTELKDKSQ